MAYTSHVSNLPMALDNWVELDVGATLNIIAQLGVKSV